MAIWHCFGLPVFRVQSRETEMGLNGKLLGGLAWIGAIALLAIPSAEFVSSRFDARPSLAMTSDAAYVQTTAAADDPVDTYIANGKPLPSYISGEPAAPAAISPAVSPNLTVPVAGTGAAPLATKPLVVPGTEPIAPAEVAIAPPEPMPAAMRPAAPSWYEPVPILDEAEVLAREAALEPLADIPEPVRDQPGFVSTDELDGWDSGSLYDYLARQGLLEGESQSRAVVTRSGDYDPDGFFLDEGPNGEPQRLPPAEIADDGDYFVVIPDYR